MVAFVKMMLDALKNLVFHGEGVKNMAGPVGIISVVSEVARGYYMVLYILFIISLNLGLMNLLPLPALDGGRLVFLIVEAIRRKPVPPEKEGMVHGIGMLLLFGLIVVVTVPGHRAPDRGVSIMDTKAVFAGNVQIGGGAPVTVQSMTNTDTRDAAATIAQIRALADAGAEIVRVSVYDEACAARRARAGGRKPRAAGGGHTL